ncbi:hypothetical protein Sango_2997700 [Sesamum angolense]|uniref:Reverse transcriptase domain-containing protein n=1 Tax=Sesamum angolense TaxID=2727404 RepID=A0AAE1T4N2_9LAMI|nr:hypothetical protein Sango_2997700 [Sesamum angolense]
MTHHLDMRYSKGNLILKLDMSKAYDMVKWKFLYAILKKMGFPARFIALIKHAIEHCWFTILVNGESSVSSNPHKVSDKVTLYHLYYSSLPQRLYLEDLTTFSHRNPDMLYQTGCKTIVTHLAYADEYHYFHQM